MNNIFFSPVLAQADLTDLKDMFSLALGVIFFFGFVYGIFLVWRGARKISDGDSEGYSSIFGGIIIASAGLIMSAFFVLAGLGDAVITPEF